MADTTHVVGSTGLAKKLIELDDGCFVDATYTGSRKAGTEVVVGGASSHLGLIAAPVNAEVLYFRHKPVAGHDVDWRVSANLVHTLQQYYARSIVDSMTITLASIVDGEAATINGVTFLAEDTATDALRSAHKFYTGGADDTADAVQLAAGINRGAYVTIGTVLVADTITIGNGVDTAKTYTAAAAAVVPSGVFSQAGTTTEDAASLTLCINHKDTVTFGTDATTWASTDPAVTEANSYATSIELMGDLNTHMASTVFHNQTTAAASSVAATTEATLIAQVIVARNTLLSHLADTAAHNIADTVRYAAVLATTVPTTAATAIVCENILVTQYKAHIATATAVAAATDTVTINGLTFTGHATTTTLATRVFSTATSLTACGDELAACINDRATITLASAVAGDSVTVNGTTFYGKTSTAVARDRRFSVDTDDTAAAVSLAALINNATYGVDGVTATSALGVITLIPDYGTTITMATGVGGVRVVCKAAAGVEGITAVNAAGVVSLTRNSADYTITMSSDAGAARIHNPIQCAVARGIPGVLATSNAAEVDICPTWSSIDGDKFSVVTSSNTMTWGRYGIPGVTATSAAAVVTVVPKATDGATVLQSVTGTAAGRWAVAYTTLLSLIIAADVVTDHAATHTTNGHLFTQAMNGYEYAYMAVTNKGGAGAMTVVVGATDH